MSFRISSLQPSTALLLFMVYAGLLGVMLSSVFLTYTHGSIARTFFISAASFGALSLYGYTTQRDLSPIGSFLIMGLFGLILAMLVNMFLKSSGLDFAISAIGVLIFAGLTAYDTQRIKEMYSANDDGTITSARQSWVRCSSISTSSTCSCSCCASWATAARRRQKDCNAAPGLMPGRLLFDSLCGA